jgi:hypothetical protein
LEKARTFNKLKSNPKSMFGEQSFGTAEFGTGAEQEKEKPVVIKLHAMRHDKRENTGPAYPHEINQGLDPDNRTPLQVVGMERAASLGRDDVDLSRARAAGSPRVRSGHTAMLHMVGGREELNEGVLTADGNKEIGKILREELTQTDAETGKLPHNQIEDLIQEMSGTNARVRVDNRLNFVDDKHAPLGSLLQQAYVDAVYLRTIVEESNQIAIAQGGEYTATYTGKAAQVADMFNDYFKAAARLREVSKKVQADQAEKHGEDLVQSSSDFERFLGSHQGLLESFMLKVVENTEGVEARDELMGSLGAGGFDESEGFDVTITELGGVVTGELVYVNKRPEALVQTKTIALTQELLEGIIEEYRKMNPDESTWVKKGENRLDSNSPEKNKHTQDPPTAWGRGSLEGST